MAAEGGLKTVLAGRGECKKAWPTAMQCTVFSARDGAQVSLLIEGEAFSTQGSGGLAKDCACAVCVGSLHPVQALCQSAHVVEQVTREGGNTAAPRTHSQALGIRCPAVGAQVRCRNSISAVDWARSHVPATLAARVEADVAGHTTSRTAGFAPWA